MPSTLGIVASGYRFSSVSGGTLDTSNTEYYFRTFTGNNTLTVSDNSIMMDIFLVAGGGGGGVDAGGGGGAGGIYLNSLLLSAASYSITIGAGGTSGTYPTVQTSGQNSTFIGGSVSVTAIGGGYGGYWNSSSGAYGGSGGGGGSWGGYRGSSAYNSSTGPYYGKNGANAVPYNSSAPVYVFAEGGGGGATEEGQYGIPYPDSGYGRGGRGGNGLTLSWNSGQYGGGGGGGSSYYVSGLSRALGGTGGGGLGQTRELAATSGTIYTGGGGGGAWGGIAGGAGQAGGSGICIVRYLRKDVGG